MIKSKTSLWLGLLASGSAWSQMPMDTDGDGVVSLAEFQARRAEVAEERFTRLDGNGDGLLTSEELAARRGRGEHRGFDPGEIDTDGDGAISLSELQSVRPGMTEERFARMDSNGDGVIAGDERSQRRGHGFRRRGRENSGSDDVTL